MTDPTQPVDEPTAATEDTQNPAAVARAQATPAEEYETVSAETDQDEAPAAPAEPTV